MATYKTFEYPLIIRETHLDTYGHVNNATYLEILEEARWEIITSNDYGLEKVRQTGQGPVILEIQIRFMKELKLRTPIIIKSQVKEYTGKIAIMRQWIEDKSGQVYCEADFKFAFFDLRQRKLLSPTPEWLRAIGLV